MDNNEKRIAALRFEISNLERAVGAAVAAASRKHSAESGGSSHSRALERLEQAVLAKEEQQDATVAAAVPHGLERLEELVLAKEACAAGDTAPLHGLQCLEQSVLAKEEDGPCGYETKADLLLLQGESTPRGLERLEQRVLAKDSPPTELAHLEDAVDSKEGSMTVNHPALHVMPGEQEGSLLIHPKPRLPRSALNGDDLEFGFHAAAAGLRESFKQSSTAIALEQPIAMPVDEDDNVHRPKAVEYDPDAKRTESIPYQKRCRYAVAAVCLLVVVGVLARSAAACVRERRDRAAQGKQREREEAIMATLERVIGNEQLHENTFAEAFRWLLQDEDATSTNLLQRFYMANLYFATAPFDICGASTSSSTCHIFTEQPRQRWLSASHECFWAGVVCDEQNQILELHLEHLHVSGTIPNGLAGFPFLTFLDMSHGDLHGTLPEAISDMKHLVELRLTHNHLTGTIPSVWPRNLYHIHLGHNLLTGQLEGTLSSWSPDLIEVDVGSNLLHGTIPDEIGVLSNAISIQLQWNNLTATIPATIGNLVHTNALSLEGNSLTGSIPTAIGTMESLSSVQFGYNQLSGTIPESLYGCERCHEIHIGTNKISGTISPEIGNLRYLEQFVVSNNLLTGHIPTEAGLLEHLIAVAVQGNAFEGAVPVCHANDAAFREIVADCLPDDRTGLAETACECCTTCCDSSGGSCLTLGL